MKRTCKICGKEFETIYRRQLCCSPECSKKKHRQMCYERSAANRKRPEELKCPNCGKVFSPWNSYQKYCSEECRDKAYSQLQKVERQKPKKPKPQPKPRTKTLAEWCREAKECNLDYGTYRALITSGKTFDELKANADSRQLPAHSHLRTGRKYS